MDKNYSFVLINILIIVCGLGVLAININRLKFYDIGSPYAMAFGFFGMALGVIGVSVYDYITGDAPALGTSRQA
jgi:uncharacterized membrane protein